MELKERLKLLSKIIMEESKVEFIYKGFDCYIKRNPQSFHLCGYVRIPETHWLFDMHYNDILNIDVHWGLTFSNYELGGKFLPNGYWIGFDCAHCDDLLPLSLILYPELTDGTYKDIEFVTKQLKQLVDQLTDKKSDNNDK